MEKIKSVSQLEKGMMYKWEDIYALSDNFYSLNQIVIIDSQSICVHLKNMGKNVLLVEKIFIEE